VKELFEHGGCDSSDYNKYSRLQGVVDNNRDTVMKILDERGYKKVHMFDRPSPRILCYSINPALPELTTRLLNFDMGFTIHLNEPKIHVISQQQSEIDILLSNGYALGGIDDYTFKKSDGYHKLSKDFETYSDIMGELEVLSRIPELSRNTND
jgi:hypothetical protein